MNQDIKKLITHLSEHSPSGTRLTGKDLLEQLWYCYLEEKTVDPHQIRDGFREIDILLAPLPSGSSSQVFDAVCQQCYRYQREAFLDGLILGAGLRQALSATEGTIFSSLSPHWKHSRHI